MLNASFPLGWLRDRHINKDFLVPSTHYAASEKGFWAPHIHQSQFMLPKPANPETGMYHLNQTISHPQHA